MNANLLILLSDAFDHLCTQIFVLLSLYTYSNFLKRNHMPARHNNYNYSKIASITLDLDVDKRE